MAVERYSVGLDSSGTINAGSAYATMLAGVSKPISVRAVRVTTSTNIGGRVSLQRTAVVASGVSWATGTGTAAGTFTGVAHRTIARAPVGKAYNAWSGSTPTGGVMRLREDILPIATGQSRDLWCEDDGPLVIEPNQGLVLVNLASGIDAGGLHINFTWEEGPR